VDSRMEGSLERREGAEIVSKHVRETLFYLAWEVLWEGSDEIAPVVREGEDILISIV
jgi:hypothetical protein